MMEILSHSNAHRGLTGSMWHRVWAILPLFLVLASAQADTTPALNVVLSKETAPPGATVQIKLSLAKPAAVSSGELALDLDPAVFGPVTAIATFSAVGDACGYATINGTHLDIHFAGTLGSAAGTPVIVITVPILATANAGAQATVTADPTGSPWNGPPGTVYAVTVTPGAVTISGSLSVSDVSPVSNLATGAVVRIRGSGFTSGAAVDIAAVSVASVQTVGPQEIAVTLAGPADLGGKRITVRNPDGSQVEFFGAPPATPLAAIGDALDGALPLFPTASYPGGFSNVIGSFDSGRIALANPNATPVDVLLESVNAVYLIGHQMTVTIPPGGIYANDFVSLQVGGEYDMLWALATAPLRMFQYVVRYNVHVPPIVLGGPSPLWPLSPGSVAPPVLGPVLSGASFIQGAIAPGEIITLRGFELGTGGLPVDLASTEVLINGKAAPLLYASPSQVNAIVPYEVAGQRAATVQVVYYDVGSQVWSLPVAPAAPGIFTQDSTGAGQAAVLNQDNSVNGSSQPAARGTVIQIFATGIPVAGAVTGSITPAAAPGTTDPVSVSIGGVTAPIQYAGPAPGEVAGVIQVNAIVPDNAPTGPAVPIFLSVSPPQGPLLLVVYPSQAGVTIAVQ